MIDLRIAATCAVAVLLLIACRDAPTVPLAAADSLLAPSLSVDSVDDMPAPASIRNAYTRVSFYDGSRGGEPSMEIQVGMEYIGNRASMTTDYSIRGPEVARSKSIYNEQDSFFDPFLWKRWSEHYVIPTGAKCDLDMEAASQHAAWWNVWIRIAPNWVGNRELKFTRDGPVYAPQCEPEPPADDGNNGGGGTTGGWVTMETCYYWAHYVNGVLVDIELRYCTYDQIPIAEE